MHGEFGGTRQDGKGSATGTSQPTKSQRLPKTSYCRLGFWSRLGRRGRNKVGKENLREPAKEMASHVSHTETFMIYEKHDLNPNWTGAQVTVKDTLQKEINIWKLPQEQLDMFTTQASRGRVKEWNAVKESGAIQVHTGRAAEAIRETLAHRIVPSRWLDKWKVSGPAANHGLSLQQQNWVDPRVEAKSRWIVQGFHDPEIVQIDMIERSVPTPATGD
eukprot:1076231-Amphidinium_carterae.1